MNWKPATSMFRCRIRGARAILLALPCTWPGWLAALTIARPNFGVPALVEPGGVVQVEVKNAAGLDANQWSALLKNDLQSWTATVEHAEYGTYIDHNTVAGYLLTVRIPPDAPPEAHQLVISHPVGGTATNKNAVAIINSFETDFYFMHYADPQAEGADPTDLVTGMRNTHGSLLELEWHAPAIRLANPRFLFDTGDELDNNFANKANYEHHKDHMSGMGVPVIVTRGNNDTLTDADWRLTFGVETYSITMGSFYICQKDYNADRYTTWLKNDYTASFNNPAIKYRLFGQHTSVGFNDWLPPAGQYPNLMLVGHGHVNKMIQTSPYRIIETQQACNKCAVGFFNFDKTATGWTCTNISNPWFQMMNSGTTAKLRCQYAAANDGAATTNSAAITNDLAANFHDGRVRFLMQHSALDYKVTGGQILAQYDYNSGSNSAVLVKVNIPASGTANVTISPEDGLSDTQAPSEPSGVSAEAQSSNSILITWNASTDNVAVTVYDIYRNGSLVSSPTSTEFTDTDLSESTLYSYTVKARDAAGNVSVGSEPASATTAAAPPTGDPVIYQAESATISGMVNKGTYLDASYNIAGNYVEWNITALGAGSHELVIRYSLGSGTDRPMKIEVNGVVVAASYSLPILSGMVWGIYADSAPLQVTLSAGVNTVRAISLTTGNPRIDYLQVTPLTAVDLDANDNGMPDAWETAHFNSTTNPRGAADYDWDHDGQNNLHEYLAGTDPTDSMDVFQITSAAMDIDHHLMLQWPSKVGKSYAIQTSDDLRGGFHDTNDAPIPGTGGMLTKSATPGPNSSGFYRIRVLP